MQAVKTFLIFLLLLPLTIHESLSNSKIPLFGRPEEGYCMDIYLGTPSQKITVVVDTGSANFAVSGSDSLTPTYFKTSESSTFASSGKTVSVTYVNGSWNGEAAKDTLALCDSGCTNGTVDLTVISTATGFFIDGSVWQGILGLAFSPIIQSPDSGPAMKPVLDALGGGERFVMTLCGREDLEPTTGLAGSLEFVDSVADGSYSVSPLVREAYYQIELTELAVGGELLDIDCYELNNPMAFLDCGTTNIILPQTPYIAVHKAVSDYSSNALSDNPINGITETSLSAFLARSEFLCVTEGTDLWSLFPVLSFGVAINATTDFTVSVPPEQYVRQTMKSINQQQSGYLCFNFGIEDGTAGVILGAVFLEGMDVHHDRTNSTVGFRVAMSCNVTEPAFDKKISDPKQRTGAAKTCLSPSSRPRFAHIVLILSATLLLLALLAGALYSCLRYTTIYGHLRDTALYGRVRMTLCWVTQRRERYQYMLNSDSEGSSVEIVADTAAV